MINFFFYCLLGPRFRREVKELVLCCLPVRTHDGIHHHRHYYHHHPNNQSHHNPNDTELNYMKPCPKETMLYLPPPESELPLKKISFRERASKLLLTRLTDVTSSRSAIIISRQHSFNLSTANLNKLRKSPSVFECSSLLLSSGIALFRTRANTASSIEFNI